MDFFISDKMKIILRYFTAIMEVIILGLLIFIFISNKDKNISTSNSSIVEVETKTSAEEIVTPEKTDEIKNFYVDIKGAVKKPGVYQVSSNNIINDLINLAGGLKSNASTKYLNLSKRVSEEMVIYIYTTTELKNISNTSQPSESCYCPTETIESCLNNQASIIISKEDKTDKEQDKVGDIPDKTESQDKEPSSDKQENSSKINLNTATKEELTKLTGIGDAKAAAIIEYRTSNGSFKTIEDLIKVSGISDKIYEKIKDNITV